MVGIASRQEEMASGGTHTPQNQNPNPVLQFTDWWERSPVIRLLVHMAVGAFLYHMFYVAGWQRDYKNDIEVLNQMYEDEVSQTAITCSGSRGAAEQSGAPDDSYFWVYWRSVCEE